MLISVRFVLFASFICAASLPAFSSEEPGKQDTPEGVVKAFFSYHFSHDMGFTPEAIKERSAWLTHEMRDACRSYFEVQQDPDEPPVINGDPFTGTQEYPDDFSVGSQKIERDSARVPITFSWKHGDSRTAVVMLRKQEAQWRIDDVEFPEHESMRQLLKMSE